MMFLLPLKVTSHVELQYSHINVCMSVRVHGSISVQQHAHGSNNTIRNGISFL